MSAIPDDVVVIIAGPTGSGKSALALALAEAVGGRILNADSMQVYAALPILTAQPDAADRARVPHYLYGMLPPTEVCSAALWRDRARDALGQAQDAGQPAILVGGTGLYLAALVDGLAPVPPIPDTVRTAARRRRAALGPDAFHAELLSLDPAASRLNPGDAARTLRAWEVVTATGQPLGAWQRRRAGGLGAGRRARWIILEPDRAALYGRCDLRLERMVAAGALDEIAALDGLGLPDDRPILKALGYRPLAAHCRGDRDLAAALAEARRDTRRYAKRQMTWFRHQGPADAMRLPAPDGGLDEKQCCANMPDILSFICKSA